MQIRLIKKGSRTLMICDRKDKTTDTIDLGDSFPAHDLAHFVVENTLGMQQGFYGNIWQGYTFAQLNDKHVIKTLPTESMHAEVITRALQTLASGACRQDDFLLMLHSELQTDNLPYPILPETIEKMQQEYEKLLQTWQQKNEITLTLEL